MLAGQLYFQVALQPMISSKGDRKGEVYAFEALLRSTHPVLMVHYRSFVQS